MARKLLAALLLVLCGCSRAAPEADRMVLGATASPYPYPFVSGHLAPSYLTQSDAGYVLLAGDGGVWAPQAPLSSVSPFAVAASEVTNLTSAGNGAYSKELSVQTTNATPNTSLSFALPSNTVGNVTVIVSGKVPSSATGVSQVWTGNVTNNAGTCAVMTTGGTFAVQGTAASTGTVATTPVSVALSSCNVVSTVTGTTSTTWNWSATLQYASAGGS
jgi:hypothetical protein